MRKRSWDWPLKCLQVMPACRETSVKSSGGDCLAETTERRSAKDQKELSTKGQCAVKRRLLLAGANPAQQLSLRLVAARADHGGNDMV